MGLTKPVWEQKELFHQLLLSLLLQKGIGDTINISLHQGGDRRDEAYVAQEILQSLGLRFTPVVIARPGCGRTTPTFFQDLAKNIQFLLEKTCNLGNQFIQELRK